MDSKQLQDMSRQLDSYTNKFYWYTINIEPKTKAETQIIVYSLAGKLEFGKVRIQIVPCFGAGSFWVDKKKLKEMVNPTISITYNGALRQLLLDTGEGRFKLSPHLPTLVQYPIQKSEFDIREFVNPIDYKG